MKLLKNFSLQNIDLIKVTSLQLLLVSLLLINQASYWIIGGVILLFSLILLGFKKYSYVIISLFFSLAMISSFELRENLNHDHYKKILNNRSIFATFELQAKDILFVNLPDIKNSNFIECEFLGFKAYDSEDFTPANGKILLFRENLKHMFNYGDKFIITGTLDFVGENLSYDKMSDNINNHSFGDYQFFLKNKNIYATIYPQKNAQVESVIPEKSIYKSISICRDFLLNHTTKNLSTPVIKNTAAALFYGCKSALDNTNKNNFVKSGTIHLFAISGLHVNLVFLVLILALIFVPFRYRYLASSLIVLLIVISTGANVPAMRAFFMILIWSIMHSYLLKISNVNLILTSGIILITFNPFYIYDVGFLYSFIITGLLLLLNDGLSSIYALNNIELNYIPEFIRFRSPAKKFFNSLLFGSISCLIAFACGSIISLLFFGNVYLISLLFNTLLMFVIMIVFYFMLFGTALSLIGFGHNFFSYLLDKSLEYFLFFADKSADIYSNLEIASIGVFEITLFYIGLFALLLAKNVRYLWLSLIAFALLLGIVFYHKYQQTSGVMIVQNPQKELAFVIYEPEINYSIVVNLESSDQSEVIAKYLSSRSIKSIDQLVVNNLSNSTIRAINRLENNLQLKSITIMTPLNKTHKALIPNLHARLLPKITVSKSKNELDQKIFNFSNQKEQMQLEYFNPATKVNSVMIYDKNNRLIELVLNNTCYSVKLDASNLTEFYYYEL